MIDLHNHVLYGVDDGAQTIDDSLTMIREAARVGFTTLVLTPHYMCYQGYTSPAAENAGRLERLKQAAAEAGIAMTLHLGNELLYDYQLNSLMGKGVFRPLGSTGWCLAETVRHGGSSLMIEQFRRTLEAAGCQMILAHPERYDFVQEDPNILFDFIEKGCLIQANYLSLTDYYKPPARATLEIMLTHGMVQLMGSDAHQADAYTRYPEAEARGIALIGEEAWRRLMVDNPEILLAGGRPQPEKMRRWQAPVRKSVIAASRL